ncbi:HPP family protein [Halorubrum sp. GN11_10-6_MGM]|uniref:HPP family protein n=1 Tax=Halorubrum sp. GN11_10-6_MGM TaxID=2518112 RepID=UPI0010F4A55F|nr:HPP family protein [Halorubrum sp. GN11_10-6_MGM]TKX75752.1 HPP family protein [Halorubrum sp. GN11_10-6_MGM]
MRRRLGTSLYAGLLFAVLGLVAWATGRPFVFPSLGPSAFVLAFDPPTDRDRAVRVVGGHLLGGLAGLAAWAVVADGAALTATPPAFSPEGFRLTASAVLSLVATSWAMIATDWVHPPACATTLIASLGLLSTPPAVAIIVASVTVLVAVHAGALLAFERVGGDAHSLSGWEETSDANG